MKITLAHGSGGKSTTELINKIFAKHFSNPVLDRMEDSAVVEGAKQIAFTTDSFVVTPLIFKGGDIGHMAVCGTVNDLLMRGAVPKYLTCGFIIEEGVETELLEQIVSSMARTAKEAGVIIVAGDTKVIDGNGGLYINTSGVGFVDEKTDISCYNLKPGDSIIVSGNLGDHHATILSARMNIENTIESDCAPLGEIVQKLIENNIEIHSLRDVTRGGLGTVLNELADASECSITIYEDKLPIDPQVKSFCKILGLNPLHMGNEGKLTVAVPKEQEQKALEIIKSCKYGKNASIIGEVSNGEGVTMITSIGGKHAVSELFGEGLPRIC